MRRHVTLVLVCAVALHWAISGCETTQTPSPQTARTTEQIKKPTTIDGPRLGRAVRRADAYLSQGKSREEIMGDCATADASDAVCAFIKDYADPDRNDAWKTFNHKSKHDFENPIHQLGMELIYIDWKITDQAEICYQRLVSKAPNVAIAHARMGLAYARKGLDDKARSFFKKALEYDPTDADALLGLAQLALKSGDKKQALDLYDQAIEAWPESEAAPLAAAKLAEENGDTERALRLYGEAAKRSPHSVDVRRTLGALLVRLGKKDEARAMLEQAAKIEPRHFATLLALAKLAEDAKDDDAAFEYYRRAGETNEENLEVQQALGAGYIKRNQPSGAERAYTQVLKLSPDDADAHLALARVNAKAKRFTEAVGHYRATLAKRPDAKVDEEREKLEKTLNISPTPAKGRNVNATFNIALKPILDAYKDRLARRPGLKGSVTLTVIINPDGSVKEVKVAVDTLKDEPILACIYWNIFDSKFPPDDKVRHFTYPITFDN